MKAEYTVNVGDNATVKMTGPVEKLDRIVEAMQAFGPPPSPSIPAPEFKIGDIVRYIGNEDPDDVMVVVGLKLRYYEHMRRHVWYYEIADKISIAQSWPDATEIEAATATTENQKWRVTGGEVPLRKMIICQRCGQLRVDDPMDCPFCSAEREES